MPGSTKRRSTRALGTSYKRLMAKMRLSRPITPWAVVLNTKGKVAANTVATGTAPPVPAQSRKYDAKKTGAGKRANPAKRTDIMRASATEGTS